MEAGRELDALIAEKVMGWRIFEKYADWIGIPIGREPYPALVWNYSNPPGWLLWSQDKKDAKIWSPSTDIAAAWQVVEKLGYNWNIYRDVGQCGDDCETQGDKLYRFIYAAPGMPMEGVTADTAPLAICLAALKALNISTN